MLKVSVFSRPPDMNINVEAKPHSHLPDMIITINAIISTEPLLPSAIIRYKQLLNLPNLITGVHGRDLFQDNLNISNLICH